MRFGAYLRHGPAPSSFLAVAVAALLVISVASSIPVQASSSSSSSSSSSDTLTTPAAGYKLVGPAPKSMPLLVTFALPLRNTAYLDSLVTEISDPSSAMYRHFLTTAQIKEDFLPVAQFTSLVAGLRAAGFAIESTELDSVVVARGTPSQLMSALDEGVNIYTNGTMSYYAATGNESFDGAYVYASNATFLFERPEYVASSQDSGNVTFSTGTFPPDDLPAVYNATSLYEEGLTGYGQTIGILDFYGSPTVVSDLQQFDQTFDYPSTQFSILPVGPYDPNLGVSEGWSPEISLDVEVSHAMAPGASIELYVANGALPLAVPLASIVEGDNVTTLAQSFGDFEWYYSQSIFLGGPAFFALNALIPDEYYALGSAEGITFLASTGDAGGSGNSAGPEGNVGYPSSSPYVTAVGGTQTYFSDVSSGTNSTQTAWSSIGYVGSGAGGGGVSILEPKPWYQDNQTVPPGYPDGRMVPDVSLQAGLDPAILIVDSGQVTGIGGTSVSAQVLSGLLTLIAESAGGGLGLINPFLYQTAENPKLYAKAFDPITTGYTTPWTASYGYNMATGWGAPNIGEMAVILDSEVQKPMLTIQGELFNSSGVGQLDYTPGQEIQLNAQISYYGALVTTGSFTMDLETLAGDTAPVRLSYDSSTGNWTGTITVGQVSGISDVLVSGSSHGVKGFAQGTLFTGYLASIVSADYDYLVPTDPWTWSPSNQLSLYVYSTDLYGDPAPSQAVTLSVEPYTLSNDSYTNSSALTMVSEYPGSGLYGGNLTDPAPAGPLSLVLGGDTYGYAPAVYGIWLQTSYIYPEVAAEPGAVAPGQALTLIASPVAPVNVYFNTAYETGGLLGSAVEVGANVTATLVTPGGVAVSTASLAYQPCAQALRVCDDGADVLYGQLSVPLDAKPGLYTVVLNATYASYTPGGNLTGYFYGQVLVSSGASVPSISVSPSTLFEGEQATIVANIAYPNGTEVKFGEYTALVYPAELQSEYTTIMHTEYANDELVPLSYNSTLDLWVGNFTAPSPYNQGALAPIAGSDLYYSGPYDAYVTGISYDGVPTTSVLSAEQAFFIQPYVAVTATSLPSGAQTSGLAFDGATITSYTSLTGDMFVGNNSVVGDNVVISDSQINGTLIVEAANVTLSGVSGGNVIAVDSTVTLRDSDIGNLKLVGSTATLSQSSFSSVSPSLPTVAVTSPAEGAVYSGRSGNLTVTGQDISSIKVYLDGSLLETLAGGKSVYAFSLVSSTIPDGVHTLTVVVAQTDGLSSSKAVTFDTDAQVVAAQNELSQQGIELIAVAALALLALLAAVFSARRRPAY